MALHAQVERCFLPPGGQGDGRCPRPRCECNSRLTPRLPTFRCGPPALLPTARSTEPPPPHAGNLSGQKNGFKNFSSIPSKFETTLYSGNKERDGFGSRAHRFTENENDLPGPGSYEDSGRIKDDKVYSKKGLGVGFVSRTKRESGFSASSSAPGPGNYNQPSSFYDEMRRSNRFNKSGSTSTFKPPSKRSVLVADEPLPGPGQYSLQRQFDPELTNKLGDQQGSVFRSQSKRSQFSAAAVASPAPGQYDPQLPSWGDAALPMSAFRSTVPIAGRVQPARMTREQLLGVVPRDVDAMPGPGEYAQPSTVFSGGSHRRSPQFCDSKLDRFGLPSGSRLNPPTATPGPGAYHRESIAPPPLAAPPPLIATRL